MFQLETHMVKIISVDLRTEIEEGKDPVGACDISITTDVANDVLNEFATGLKESFYVVADTPQQDLIASETYLPKPKFPGFARFPWKADLEGYTFVVHIGTGGPSEVTMLDVKVNKITFKIKDKAIVEMCFIIRGHDNPGDIDKLRKLLGLEVQISLVPPDKAKQHQIEQGKKNQRLALEDHFSGGEQTSGTGDADAEHDAAEGGQAADDPDSSEVEKAAGQGQYQVE
ncbi:hypothetical protein EJD96_00235 (plasmid) [Herbaspirillum seropedicae]|uniref:hypothetical protein n=1 Tax=Herbaspirillum seropedicae TaxID=964 RepID=UPI001123FA33|nr:hypothetical protein [Herbaspirillum seropedicae]QDD62677.1 hypothetical protein EJD96_00235 [Herbaspirillum seropedicae]